MGGDRPHHSVFERECSRLARTLAPEIRVLRIIGVLDPRYGGPSESSVNACIASQEVGVRNTFAFPVADDARQATDPVCRRLMEAGVSVHTFPLVRLAPQYASRWGLSPRLAVWAARVVNDYDIVHIHQTWGFVHVGALLAGLAARRPVVVSPHESLTEYDVGHTRPAAKRILKRLYIRGASAIVFSSPLEADDSLPLHYHGRRAVIPHPVDRVTTTGSAPRRRRSDGLVVGFLGRLHHKKNVDLLIRAVSGAPVGVRLRIAGDGTPSDKARLVSLVRELDLDDRVDWLGFVSRRERQAFLESIDVLAMPSRYECFGMAAAEAMAHGVPTVVSSTSGIAAIVKRYECGVVIVPEVGTLTRVLRELERDGERLVELGRRAAAAALAELSMESHGARIRHEYEVLLARD